MALRLDGPVRGERAVRQTVGERSGGICELFVPAVCLHTAGNISHRKARGQGGIWSTANCMDSCGSGTTGCHGWVESHWTEAHALGLRLSRAENPADVRLLMRTAQWPLGWYRLDDYGTLSFAPTGETTEN